MIGMAYLANRAFVSIWFIFISFKSRFDYYKCKCQFTWGMFHFTTNLLYLFRSQNRISLDLELKRPRPDMWFC